MGNGLADGLGVGDGLGAGLSGGLALALGLVALAVPPAKLVGVAEPVLAGENVVGVAAGEDPAQAETDTEASMVKVAQPMAVNVALSPVPAMVVRILMGPPHASGRWLARSRSRHQKPASEGKLRGRPGAASVGRGQVSESAIDHKSRARGRRGHAMACSSLGY